MWPSNWRRCRATAQLSRFISSLRRWCRRLQRAALPQHDDAVQLFAFDILALDGDDLRGLPLSMRVTNLDWLLARRPDGIFVAPFEQGEIGPDLISRADMARGQGGAARAPISRSPRPHRARRQRPNPAEQHTPRQAALTRATCDRDGGRPSRIGNEVVPLRLGHLRKNWHPP
jgi:hypothetical protein